MNQNSNAPSANAGAAASNPSHPTKSDALSVKGAGAGDVRAVADEVKQVAGNVVDHARKSAEQQLSGGKDRIAEGLDGVAEALRHTGRHLRTQDKAGITDYVVRAADQVELASGYLQNRTLGQIVGDTETFARREPALFLGGAFVVGLVGGRFLKSSRPEQAGDHPARRDDRQLAPRDSMALSYAGGNQGGSRSPLTDGAHGASEGQTTARPATSSTTAKGSPWSKEGALHRNGGSGGEKTPGAV